MGKDCEVPFKVSLQIGIHEIATLEYIFFDNPKYKVYK